MQQDSLQIIIALVLIPLLFLAIWRIRLKKLKVYNSPLLGKIEVLEKYDHEKVLTINSYIQGISIEKESVKKTYEFQVANKTAQFCKDQKNCQVLMLGLGANTISNLIAKLNPGIFLTIIEIDPFIIQACTDFFDLKKLPKYQLIKGDAYQIIDQKKLFSKLFDVIIVDIFTGEPPYISLDSNKPNFIRKLLPLLKSNGQIIFNRPAHTLKVREDGEKLEQYLKTMFKETTIVDVKDPRGYRNFIITASNKLDK